MSLSSRKFLFLDCQTTGMRPPAGHLLEFAWTLASAEDEAPKVSSFLIQLPAGEEIPYRVREITGIDNLEGAVTLETVFSEFKSLLCAVGDDAAAVIHYAQFEKPFLLDLFSRYGEKAEIPFPILCSHQLCKRVFPNLPSQNIRGAAGFFGVAPGALKRAASHVSATHQIWRGLIPELEKLNLENLAAVNAWMQAAPKKKATRYEYRLDKLKRLELPDSPGIYRMISKTGEILYVGKATSLKSRVNSYFRGQKGRDVRKLEMLAQVWDLKVTDCASPLEAALLESDEIKRHNPPYNLVLKRGRRHLMFYDREFNRASQTQSETYPIGPFRNSNWIEHLRLLFRSLNQPEFEQIFFDPVPPEHARQGFELFLSLNGIMLSEIKSVRSLLALGHWLLKNHVEEESVDTKEEEETETAEEKPLTIEELAAKFERLLRRSAAEYRRGKELTSLLDSRIRYRTKNGERELRFTHGRLGGGEPGPQSPNPWETLGIDDFDRMSILLSELQKYDHKIEN